MSTQAAEITLDGVTCKFDLFTRRVWWMSDWSRAYELNQTGYLNREWRNGHGDPYAQDEIYTVPDPYIGAKAVTVL